jgi:hypothetical protein
VLKTLQSQKISANTIEMERSDFYCFESAYEMFDFTRIPYKSINEIHYDGSFNIGFKKIKQQIIETVTILSAKKIKTRTNNLETTFPKQIHRKNKKPEISKQKIFILSPEDIEFYQNIFQK